MRKRWAKAVKGIPNQPKTMHGDLRGHFHPKPFHDSMIFKNFLGEKYARTLETGQYIQNDWNGEI